MADITITIQAASDALMTTTGTHSGTVLADDDARKVYGLPNITSVGLTDPDQGTVAKIVWHTVAEGNPRWDTIMGAEHQGPKWLSPGIYSDYEWAYASSLLSGDTGGGTKPNPTTTAFQLRCENISHEFTDNVAISPIPAFDTSPGQHDSAGTPGQLNMIVLALGMRTEIIKLSGVLVDRGLVTASNPRRQILLNIARMQHYKTGRGGQGGNDAEAWGGEQSGLLNPRSYPCLRIYESHATPGYTFGKEPSGDSRQYRGIIKDLSFRLEGGRPDHWFWNMTFAVISNEHSPLPIRDNPWIANINRIRLVDDDDGSGDPVDTDEDGYFEVRSANDLTWKDPEGEVALQFKQGQVVYLSNTNSVPTINGNWEITGINLDDRTFIIKKNGDGSDSYGEITVIMKSSNNENAGGNAGELKWNEANFTAGNDGHVAAWADVTGLSTLIKAKS